MNEQRDDAVVRDVLDQDGRRWHVFVVLEGMRWDPEIEMRRRHWLCLETKGDRRYIAPVPTGWERWSDAELIAAIAMAKPDKRGP